MLHEEELMDRALPLKIVGVVRPSEDASNADVSTAVAYTSELTDYLIRHTNESAVIEAQEKDPKTNVLTGMAFDAEGDEAKAQSAREYLGSLGISEKASFFQLVMYYAARDGENSGSAGNQAGMSQLAAMDENAMAAALDQWLAVIRIRRFC